MTRTSTLEATFTRLLQTADPWLAERTVREHRFDDKRRWRFDFAWPSSRVAVELEGGLYTRGRHMRPTGFAADCEKYNAAALAGWTVLRYTATDLRRRPVQVVEQIRLAVDLGEVMR